MKALKKTLLAIVRNPFILNIKFNVVETDEEGWIDFDANIGIFWIALIILIIL